jgi:hypothetical protein
MLDINALMTLNAGGVRHVTPWVVSQCRNDALQPYPATVDITAGIRVVCHSFSPFSLEPPVSAIPEHVAAYVATKN